MMMTAQPFLGAQVLPREPVTAQGPPKANDPSHILGQVSQLGGGAAPPGKGMATSGAAQSGRGLRDCGTQLDTAGNRNRGSRESSWGFGVPWETPPSRLWRRLSED